jgi:putative RecB family exonuclease
VFTPDDAPPPYASTIVLAPLPTGLSPSKIATFTECPRRFQYSAIDRLDEPPTIWTLKGTLVHSALEALFCLPPERRAIDEALTGLDEAAKDARFREELATLGLSGLEEERFVADAETLVRNYFAMEDPRAVDAVGVELRIDTELSLGAEVEPLLLRGIIDRLDRDKDGCLTIVDYKTGRAPQIGREREKLAGVETYALLCERALGVRPVAVRLLYLRDQLVVEREISEREVSRQQRRASEVWRAIGRAYSAGSFRPSPSRLCSFCAFNDRCEAAQLPSK